MRLGQAELPQRASVRVHGGPGPVQRKHVEVPFDRDRRWQVADGFVARLILKLSRNREDFPIFPKRAPEL